MVIQPIFGPFPTSVARFESSSLPMLLLLWQLQLLLMQGLHFVNECNVHAPSTTLVKLQPT
jgi:hypothetical protein